MIHSSLRSQWTLTRGLAIADRLFDVSSAQIAILDSRGVILAVNSKWRDLAMRQRLDENILGIGADYLAVCEAASEAGVPDAAAIGQAIRDVLNGRRSDVTHRYLSGDFEYDLRLLRFEEDESPRVIVAHLLRM